MPVEGDNSLPEPAATEAELVARCLAGEEDAVAELVRRFHARVFGLCLRMLGQRQDAEDAAQESLLRAVRGLHTWDPRRALAPWVLAIAANRCRTHLAARQRRPRPLQLVDHLPDERPDGRAADQLAEEVELALRRLRDEYRQAFVLFHEHEMSYAEIAETMDCPLGTVKTWVHRARRELVQHLVRRGAATERRDALRRV